MQCWDRTRGRPGRPGGRRLRGETQRTAVIGAALAFSRLCVLRSTMFTVLRLIDLFTIHFFVVYGLSISNPKSSISMSFSCNKKDRVGWANYTARGFTTSAEPLIGSTKRRRWRAWALQADLFLFYSRFAHCAQVGFSCEKGTGQPCAVCGLHSSACRACKIRQT